MVATIRAQEFENKASNGRSVHDDEDAEVEPQAQQQCQEQRQSQAIVPKGTERCTERKPGKSSHTHAHMHTADTSEQSGELERR